MGIDTPMVKLMCKKLLEMDGLHRMKMTPRGEWAGQGIMAGSQIRVTCDYKLLHMHGKIGVVQAVLDAQVDADGIDEYGYVIKRAKPFAYLTVRFPNEPGEWCFYNLGDVEAVWLSGVGIEGYRKSC